MIIRKAGQKMPLWKNQTGKRKWRITEPKKLGETWNQGGDPSYGGHPFSWGNQQIPEEAAERIKSWAELDGLEEW